MKMKTADELKECSAIAKSAQEEVVGLQMWAQFTERELQAVSESIKSLPNLEDIDVLNRRHYLCQRIRKGISDIIDTMDYSGIASEAFRREMGDLEKKIEAALRQVEAENQNH